MKLGAVFAVVAAVSMIASCAQQAWVYNGKRYTDINLLKADTEANNQRILAQMKPLDRPVTNRDLRIIVPERGWYYNTKLEYIKVGMPLATIDVLNNDYVFENNYYENTRIYRAIERKNIFPKVTQSAVSGQPDIQPSDEYDALVFSVGMKPPAMDQWYYVSKRNGKQVITFDQNLPEISDRVDSLLNAIKAAALQ